MTQQQDELDVQQAVRLHQQGKFPDAEAIYRRVLVRNPNQSDALHMLGLLAYQVGHADAAVDLIERSLSLAPNNEIACSNLAEIQRSRGQFGAAISLCERALRINPNLASGHANLAAIFRQTGRLEEALAASMALLKLDPQSANGCSSAGATLLDLNRPEEALPLLERAAHLAPNNAAIASNLGLCYARLCEFARSIAFHRRAVALEPTNGTILMNLAVALAEAGEFREAAEHFQTLANAQPHRAEIIQNLAAAHCDLHNHAEALKCAHRALQLDSTHIETFITLANTHCALGQFDDAIRYLSQARNIRETSKIHQAMATALVGKGEPEKALPENARAIELDPADPIPQFDRSIIFLYLGRLEEAWPFYETRFQHPRLKPFIQHFDKPRWNGEPIAGKRLLVQCEQGLGDTVCFSRYATLLAQQNIHVILRVQPSLVDVIKTISGACEVVPEIAPPPPFDFHIPLMSLPGVFKTSLDTIPNTVPYITADPTRKAHWQREFAARTNKLKVGIAWEGGPFQPENRLRSASLAAFAPLADLPVTFFSLQKGDAAAQSKSPPPGMDFQDLAPHIHDFTDTAAMIEALDLVISIDTCVIHVAGALAKPVWTLLAYFRGHMWMTQRHDSPWYPTMRLFRQPKFQDWLSVVEQVRTELTTLLQQKEK
ncbi:MAG TPA: tetratricopeptide repeat protein [Phycisphaerae bacterium]|nr:tetratricopeptide repeat protein [Phycisphaerae bacterium]